MPKSQRPPGRSSGSTEMLTVADVAHRRVLAAIQTIIARGDQAAARVIRAETGLGQSQVISALRLLKLRGKIAVVGQRRTAHWRLT